MLKVAQSSAEGYFTTRPKQQIAAAHYTAKEQA